MAEWTPEMDNALRERWAHGQATRQIGEALGVSKNAIIGRSRRLGLQRRRSPIKPKAVAAPRPKYARLPKAPKAPVAKPSIVEQIMTIAAQPPIRLVEPPMPAPEPEPPPALVAAPTVSVRIDSYSFVGPAHTCQWITEHRRPWPKCGDPSMPGRSWCAHHLAIVFEHKRSQNAA